VARGWIRIVVAVLVVAVLAGVAGYPVYVRPQVDPLRKADAILVVGGAAPKQRYRYGFDLARRGWAPHLVLSNPSGQAGAACATRDPRFTLECFDPRPPTTLGEARELRRMAHERHWRTVIVVTYTPHVSRARYIVEKCFDGELIMAASPAQLSVLDWAWIYVYQTAGYVKSALQGGC